MTTAQSTEDKELVEAREMARTIITQHFGKSPKRVAPVHGGLSNFVFSVCHPDGKFIVRISPSQDKLHTFVKEQWAVKRARGVGVPTPEVLEVGNAIVRYPYMVARSVAGHEATYHPDRDRVLRALGRYAASIHSIRTTGFGSTFDWSENRLSRNSTWNEFLHLELNMSSRIELLEKHRMLSAKQVQILRRTLEDNGFDAFPLSLNHGDLRLKNTMVNKDGEIVAIIDWEHAISNPAPLWEFAIALHDLSIDAKQVFLSGYGLEERQVREMAPFIKALNVINYTRQIEQIVQDKDLARLEQYRTRLSGALDLYSLTS